MKRTIKIPILESKKTKQETELLDQKQSAMSWLKTFLIIVIILTIISSRSNEFGKFLWLITFLSGFLTVFFAISYFVICKRHNNLIKKDTEKLLVDSEAYKKMLEIKGVQDDSLLDHI